MKNYFKRKILPLLLATVMVFSIIPHNTQAAKAYSLYVSKVSIKRSGNTYTVNYTAGKVPNGVTCYIGYEDWTGTVRKEQFIGGKGKHTIEWNINSSVFRIYTKLVARNYTDKDIVRTYHHVKTGTTSYKVTQKDVNSANFQAVAGNVIITLTGTLLGFYKVGLGLAATLGGLTYSNVAQFKKYSPSKGDIIKTTRSYDTSTETLTVTVRVYRNGSVQYKMTSKHHIGF